MKSNQILSPERAGIASAMSANGLLLPVIDVTHPRFALLDDAASNAALFSAYLEAERQQARIPQFVTRVLLSLAARNSLLLRALLHSDTGFLDGLMTYVMKLGADNLPPPFNSKVDRRVAATPHVISMRLRLQQCAELLADGLQQALLDAPSAPLHFINIGGGTAIDSLNALLLLQHRAAYLLARPIRITVFDLDRDGPIFGAHAAAALTGDGRALSGLDLHFRHEPYDWNQVAPLAEAVHGATAGDTLLAVSSEGGLFEYGSDAAIVANLSALSSGHPRAALVVGSVTRPDPALRGRIAGGKFKLIPRGVDGFAPLASRGGFVVTRVRSTPLSDQVLLHRRGQVLQ
jgi:hypothetical protein